MKQFFKIIPVIICMIILIGCMQGSKNTGWEVVKTFKTLTNAAGSKDITNIPIGFLNNKIGFSSFKKNYVYYSSDGGENWFETSIPVMSNLSGIEIIDEKNIIIGNDFQEILYSNDSGKTWEKIEKSKSIMMSFYNNNSGMIAGSNAINIIKIIENYKTVDEIKLPKEFKKISMIAITCLSSNEAYVLFYGKGPLLKTKDRGKTWEIINFDVLKNKLIFKSTEVTSMRFTDSNNGIIVTFDKKDKTWISLTTKDSGKSWKYSKIFNTVRGLRSYLSKDGNYLTIVNENKDENPIMLLKRKI